MCAAPALRHQIGLPPEKWSSKKYGFMSLKGTRMAGKRLISEEIVARLRQVESPMAGYVHHVYSSRAA